MIDPTAPAYAAAAVAIIGSAGICAGVIRWARGKVAAAERILHAVVDRSNGFAVRMTDYKARAETAEAKLAAISKRDPVTGRFTRGEG